MLLRRHRDQQATRMWLLAASIQPPIATRMGAAVPLMAPARSIACTPMNGPGAPAGSAIAVSKPLRGACATTLNAFGAGPASTRQLATSVAPFQLANAVAPPLAAATTVNAGGCAGVALHAKRK